MWHAEHWQEAGGWIVVDETGTAEPTAPITDRKTAEAAAAEINASYAAWNARGLADAPHMDSF